MNEPTRPLPALVWDMGGIMYRYFTELLIDRAAAHGWPTVALGPTGSLPDPDYDAQLRGDIDESDYLALVRGRLASVGVEIDPVTAFDFTEERRPATWALIEELHAAGHPQALLTNDASKWLGAAWWETWEPVAWFDAIIDVAVLGVRKPAPEPFLAAAAELGVEPSDCIFVDDMDVNCAGAEAVGMRSHLFDITAPEHAIRVLRHRLGREPSVTTRGTDHQRP